MAITCINGHSNVEGMSFCEECGAELTNLTDRPAIDPYAAGLGTTIEPTASPIAATSVEQPDAGAAVVELPQVLVPDEEPIVAAAPLDPAIDVVPTPAGVGAGTPAVPGAAHASLEVMTGPFAGQRFPVTEPTCTVGRWDMDSGAFPEVDLTEIDTGAHVSRKHLRISELNGHYTVEDLGSLTGTSLNRSPRLLPGDVRPLQSGDEMIVGRLFLKFVIE